MTRTRTIDFDNVMDSAQKEAHTHFPADHWLSSPKNMRQFMMMTTYYRRNLHRFAKEYLGLKLHIYQSILLFMMSRSTMVVAIASRAAAKSYVIAIYACCMAILYPNIGIVITSSTRGQSELIISKKIRQELCGRSPMLRREIKEIIDNPQKAMVTFRGGGTIFTVTCNDNARGQRCNIAIIDEARACDQVTLNKVIFPFLVVRQADFMGLPEYRDIAEFRDEPKHILISSSTEESHWLYKMAVTTKDDMLNGKDSFFMAMDLSVTLKHGIRTYAQLRTAKKSSDPITWKIEYENAVLRSNAHAYFTYDVVAKNQVLKKAFYPRRSEEYVNNKRNKYAIPKQPGEVRIVAADIAMVNRDANDNSVFTCMRLFPNIVERGDGTQQKEWRVQVPYLEGIRGTETSRQAIRIRQLYEDFEADFIILDVRNAGVSVYDCLAKVLYDDERGVEYAPLKCMNDSAFANRIKNPNAKEAIYCVSAFSKLNSDMAVNLRTMLDERQIDLLVPKDDGVDEIRKYVANYDTLNDPEEQLYYEKPYLETMFLLNELINLEYERLPNTGIIRIREQSGMMKDRYSSLAMGCYFVSMLARDMLGYEDEVDLSNVPICVTTINF